MPELPEVETVKRGLESLLPLSETRINKIECSDKPLRFHPKPGAIKKVRDQKLLGLERKAKYLLFKLQDHILLSHLGMTGSWRIEQDRRTHDHIRIFLKDGRVLTYHDARRFGMFDVLGKETYLKDPRLSGLGLDPVKDKEFSGDWLYEKTRNRKVKLKTFIMDQKWIVGVGNIYASESLFLAGIHPKKWAYQLSRDQAHRLANSIQEVLQDAIAWGGTTISDFKQAGGSAGYFQNLLLVYGRAGEACHFCETKIKSQAIVGRNSFWCPDCQKLR